LFGVSKLLTATSNLGEQFKRSFSAEVMERWECLMEIQDDSSPTNQKDKIAWAFDSSGKHTFK
jgi:hypothetical protein